ncbi:MAG: hypothetical protein CSB55_07845 [Candidatus Cloacimonadota bacterium]|nr:MAG: hypothetical protein CSB55_07845 [Candidatus Cloacimonadota bacterium]
MKNSVIISICFVLGIFAGKYNLLPLFIIKSQISLTVLYCLVFFVGISIGSNPNHFQVLRKSPVRILLVPGATAVGTLIGSALMSFFIKDYGVIETTSAGAGFGYYSLSCFQLTELHSEELGITALLANMSREIITLIFAPLMARYFGPLGVISGGGATSMDTTLPVITEYAGKDFSLISVFHGVVLTVAVPAVINFLFIFY